MTAMTPEQWADSQTLFDELCDLPAARRERALAALDDVAVAAAVRRMLAGDGRGAGVLERGPAGGAERLLAELAAIGPAGSTAQSPNATEEPGRAPSPGDQVGPWRIVREIGRGGMGIVYLAERAEGEYEQTAALKLIKRGMDSDAILLRFRTERQVMATLRHPYIARFYDGGVSERGRPWFAMEHVEGLPITEYCGEHDLSLDQRLELFAQVCRAVAHAHERKIIHRDLKPSNILVTAQGEPRILDFGLAKVLRDPSGDPATTRMEQRWLTLEYASPAQMRGDSVGATSDTYQLGLVLYEMLTGRRPYTVRDLTAAQAERVICEQQPPKPSAAVASGDERLRRRLKGDLDTIVLKALHKDPARGYASAAALADDIELHRQGLPVAARADTWLYRTGKRVRRNQLSLLAGAAGVLLIAASVAAALWVGRADSSGLAIAVNRAQKVTFDPGLELDPAVSPAGDAIAYAAGPLAAMRIYLRRLGESHGAPLSPVSLGHARHPRWSPDGSRIVFQAASSAWVVAPAGGKPRRLVPGNATESVRWLEWSPDGTQVAYVTGGAIWTRRVAGGAPRRIARPDSGHGLAWSPDGRWIAYVDGNAAFLGKVDDPGASVTVGNLGPSSIWVVPAAGGRPRRITRDEDLDVSPVWTPDGRMLLFVSSIGGGRDVYAIALDGEARPRGPARRLTTGLQAHTISLAADGRLLAYSSFAATSNIHSIAIPDGEARSSREAEPITAGSQVVEGLSVSSDGRWLAFDSDRFGNQDIFKMALPDGEPTRLTAHAGDDFMPAWSPDGREVAYHSFLGARRQIRIVAANASHDRPAFPTRGEQNYPQWSPGGDHITFHANDIGGPRLHLLAREPDGTWRSPEPLGLQPAGVARWSPDGREIAFLGANSLWLLDVETRQARPLLAAEVASAIRTPFFPLWSVDGRRLYFKAIDVLGQAGIWSVLPDGGGLTLVLRFDDPRRPSNRAELATDGERLYFTLATLESDIGILEMEGELRAR